MRTTKEAIEIFTQRIQELGYIKGLDLNSIRDSTVRSKAVMNLATLRLNERLLMIFSQPTGRLS